MKNNSIYPENKVRLKGLPLVTGVETTSPEILYISNKLNMIPKLVHFTSGSFNDGQRVNKETKWSIYILVSKTSENRRYILTETLHVVVLKTPVSIDLSQRLHIPSR